MTQLRKASMLLLGVFFSVLFFVKLTLHNDHVQILKKAFLYIDTGVLTHFGNAATGVGFVPGTFQTIITALPMQVYFSPYSAMAVILLFHLISWWMLAKIMKENFGEVVVVPFLLLYWLNPWRVEQSELYNPAYVFLFSAIHFYTCYYMKKPSFWLSFFNVLAIGFCAQLHYSAIILAILSLMLFAFRYVKVNWYGVAAGTLAVIASLIPYLMHYFSDQSLQVTMNKSDNSFFARNLVMVYPVLKGITYWIRYGAISYGRHIFSEINFLWISEGLARTIVSTCFHGSKWIFAAITVVFSTRVQWRLGRDIWKSKPFTRKDRTDISDLDRIYFYGFYMFFAMLLAVGMSPVELNHWHLILCFPFISMVMTIAFLNLKKQLSQQKYRGLFLALLVIFTMFNIFGALGSRSHSYKSNFHEQVLKFYKSEYPQ